VKPTKITAKLLRSWEACWSDEQIKTKLAGRKSVTAREIAADESVSLDDRLWVLCQLLAHLDESAAHLYAIESASLVAHLAGDEDDQAQYLSLLNSLHEIEDLPVEQRGAARDAARGAAWDAARDAARDAAGDAAWGAAWDAARGAAWDAALGAARGAALREAIARALEWLGGFAGAAK
jgi:hypothetical protein